MTPPTAEQIQQAWEDPKLANLLYHDWEADTYDDKWSISFDERCISYATDRFRNVAGEQGWPYGSALELGCGTGFFLLNLKLGGVLDDGHVTDLSPGMVDVAKRNGTHLGFELEGRVADAETLPYPDESFDLVIGHAVLHHIPDLEQALREVMRVLKPGGRFVFAGEPTAKGDFVARKLSQLTWSAAKRITHLPGLRDRYARSDAELDESSRAAVLEAVVDIHTFDPTELRQMCERVGAVDVSTVTEEFTASWFGWPVRTVEAAVKPGALGWKWAYFAYGTWLALSALDAKVFNKIVPAQYFYNVSVTGIKA
ncbi:MAG: class I SAM-dependent methyltransferase [Actinobacteria bacterium]|nr:class I SAM-dependent methyltransferase [Actinomycetota bacterium]MCB8996511.1 class I SAM-dependent methyltransferase [Actinomycetota bacterium]MCB9425267.1 class I SAM-dependent methyltransferase [Actinomycetota bacterium]HRY08527.1 class I SAM-dependent methyltransferase [Candidatus Nanopelagicales bacterium]